ncbi:MAG: monoamine oxidase [Myxococcota bacterium]|jgi:monoamine oxidase
MNRRDMMKQCAALTATIPFFSWLTGCDTEGGLYDNFEVNFTGKVLIIGAGAAGLAAGYILDRYGIDFQIIEASPRIGGRVRAVEDFADFPIDLGAEWIHEAPSVLSDLIDDVTVEGAIDVVPYSPDTVYSYSNDRLTRLNAGGNYYSEYKFKKTTWFSFLQEYIAANITDRIVLSSPVADIDYSGDTVIVTDINGEQYEGDRILVTVPTKILQGESIHFQPALPDAKLSAINAVEIPPGLKVIFEFSERFYPDITLVGGSDQIYFDTAFRKDSDRNILSLFYVSPDANRFTDLAGDQEIVDAVLAELDAIFDGKASATYLNHVVQNWSAEPYIQGAYTYTVQGNEEDVILALQEPVEGLVYFAGESCSLYNTATVPGAMQSGYAAVEALLKG